MAVRFDAATDRVSYSASNPPAPSAGMTITAWAYLSADQNNNTTFARLHAASGGSTVGTFATSSDGTSGPNYFSTGGSVTNATGFVVGAWRKVAWSASGTTGKSYVATVGGATEVDSGTVATGTAPTGITLGGRSAGDSTEWLNGRLAYVRVWSAELSQAEIEAEWASTVPVRTANLWADWPLSVHTDLTDHSGNGRNLVAGSTATTTEDGPPIASGATLGVAVETDAAVALAGSKRRTLGEAGETDEARPLVGSKRRALGVAVETDEALPLSGGQDHDYAATLAEQAGPVATLGGRRWAATLEAQPA